MVLKIRVFWLFLSLLQFINLQGQNTLNSRLVFEFYKNDTSSETIFDTIFIAISPNGGPGYQPGLDKYVDSLNEPDVYIYDSLFEKKFPNKYLKYSVDSFQTLKTYLRFRVRTIGFLKNIYWDSSDFNDFRGGRYWSGFELIGPKGSSIGSWDSEIVTLISGSYTYRNRKIDVYELPYWSEISFYVNLIDTSLVGGIINELPTAINIFQKDENSVVVKFTNKMPSISSDLTLIDNFGKSQKYILSQIDEVTYLFTIDNIPTGIYYYQIPSRGGILQGKIFILK